MWGFPMAFVAILSHNLHWNVLLLVLSASGITIRTRLWMDYRAWLGMAWKHTIWETLVVLDYFGASGYDPCFPMFSCHCISLLGSIADHCWSCQWRPQVSCQGLDRLPNGASENQGTHFSIQNQWFPHWTSAILSLSFMIYLGSSIQRNSDEWFLFCCHEQIT